MAAKKKIQVHSTSKTLTYTYCWVAASRALKIAQGVNGTIYERMMAGVFAAFTVEAYLNHLGQSRIPNWSMLEKKLGPDDKLVVIQDWLHFRVDISRRPFQTLAQMMQLRNLLAHGKTEDTKSDRIVDDQQDESARYPQPKWKNLCSLQSVDRMVKDAEQMIRQLSASSGSKDGYDPLAVAQTGMYSAVEIETDPNYTAAPHAARKSKS